MAGHRVWGDAEGVAKAINVISYSITSSIKIKLNDMRWHIKAKRHAAWMHTGYRTLPIGSLTLQASPLILSQCMEALLRVCAAYNLKSPSDLAGALKAFSFLSICQGSCCCCCCSAIRWPLPFPAINPTRPTHPSGLLNRSEHKLHLISFRRQCNNWLASGICI